MWLVIWFIVTVLGSCGIVALTKNQRYVVEKTLIGVDYGFEGRQALINKKEIKRL